MPALDLHRERDEPPGNGDRPPGTIKFAGQPQPQLHGVHRLDLPLTGRRETYPPGVAARS